MFPRYRRRRHVPRTKICSGSCASTQTDMFRLFISIILFSKDAHRIASIVERRLLSRARVMRVLCVMCDVECRPYICIAYCLWEALHISHVARTTRCENAHFARTTSNIARKRPSLKVFNSITTLSISFKLGSQVYHILISKRLQ